jgi:hypothetical protein
MGVARGAARSIDLVSRDLAGWAELSHVEQDERMLAYPVGDYGVR